MVRVTSNYWCKFSVVQMQGRPNPGLMDPAMMFLVHDAVKIFLLRESSFIVAVSRV